MKAAEARKLTNAHSNRMQQIYAGIAGAAEKGCDHVYLFTGDITCSEQEVLRENGYTITYETSETDGGQMVLVKW